MGRLRIKLLIGAFLITASLSAQAQLSPNAPPDAPMTATSKAQLDALESAVAPYIKKARLTFPDAKAKFMAGLPEGETFFVTTLLHDGDKREQIFVMVESIKQGRIYGRIASEIALIKKYHAGDAFEFPESDLRDWTISKSDGTEEGNYVGKFLDTYQPG